MKESIGATWIFIVAITFILLFTAIMSMTINRSRAFSVKDNILVEIEKYNGLDINVATLNDRGNPGGLAVLNAMTNDSYRSVGVCPEGYAGFDRNGNRTSTNASVCIKVTVDNPGGGTFEQDNNVGCYYSIMVFYRLEIPVLKDVFNFNLTGETKKLYGAACSG